MTIGQIIRELRISKGLTQKELGAIVGVSKHTIMRYENGETFPNFKILSKLESFFGVQLGYNPDPSTQVATVLSKTATISERIARLTSWLKSLDRDRLDKVEQLLELAGMYKRTADIVMDDGRPDEAQFNVKPSGVVLSIAGRAAAGMPMEMVPIHNEAIPVDHATRARPGDFIVIAVGDSMVDAGIRDGSRCIVRPQPAVENGQVALVAVGDDSTIKRFYKDEDGFRLVPCNPAHRVQRYAPDTPIRILGRIVSVME